MEAVSYLLLIITGVAIYAGISRWIFKVNDHIENQETIIQLLGQLLLRQGLTEDEVRKILNKKNKKS